MAKKWIAVNALLLIVAGLLGWQLKVSISHFKASNDPAKIVPPSDPKRKLTQESGLPPLQPRPVYSASQFGVIPDKNVFSETRAREEKEEQTVAVPETPPMQANQRPILVGITIAGNQRMASIVDPSGSRQAPGRQTETKRVGDVYLGYTITDITESQIVLESGTRREVIGLYDGMKRKEGKTPIIATRIVSFGGGAMGGETSTPTRPVSTPARGSSPTAPSQASIGGAAGSTPAAQGGVRPVIPAQISPSPQPSAAPQTSGRVIRTPFGDIVPNKPPNQ